MISFLPFEIRLNQKNEIITFISWQIRYSPNPYNDYIFHIVILNNYTNHHLSNCLNYSMKSVR